MATDFKPAGLTKVGFSTDGGTTFTIIDAKVVGAENLAPEAIEQALTYTKMQSARTLNPTVEFTGFDDYATMNTAAQNRTEYTMGYEYGNGDFHFIAEKPTPILVQPNPKAATADGDMTWTLEQLLEHKSALGTPQTGALPTA